MAQQLKVTATKPDSLTVTPRTHMVEGNDAWSSHPLTSTLWHTQRSKIK